MGRVVNLFGDLVNVVGLLCLIILMVTIIGWIAGASILFVLDIPRYEIRNKITKRWVDRRVKRAEEKVRKPRQTVANYRLRTGMVPTHWQERLTKAEARLEDAQAAQREWEPRTRSRVDW